MTSCFFYAETEVEPLKRVNADGLKKGFIRATIPMPKVSWIPSPLFHTLGLAYDVYPYSGVVNF